ncbi:hypothetical protein [Kurthia senegalensis]|uniref:hypothetical protein n=1 Tax=Kurthia senegalensis TaxID=1033740 RepID=UPI000289DC0B|nr:hypothetical protein [Kurthia senegalensis]
MLNVTVSKGEKHYIVDYVSDNLISQMEHTTESFLESIYTLGRKIHLNDVHFEIPKELANKVTAFLKIEFPGELYEHKISVV